MCNREDRLFVETFWKGTIKKENPCAWSESHDLATLVEISGDPFRSLVPGIQVCTTEFKDYVAIMRSSGMQPRPMSRALYDAMRVVAVGAALRTSDGKVLVHRRSAEATHAPNRIDCSCAGLCHLTPERQIDIVTDLAEKLQRELGMDFSELSAIGLTGIHSSAEPDFSGMFDFCLQTFLESKQVEERIKTLEKERVEAGTSPTFSEYFFVSEADLPRFVLKHYCETGDMVGDGAAALLGLTDNTTFFETVKQIQKCGREWRFGNLTNSDFQ